MPDAYAAAKAINAVVMSLAAVPAYFIARRVAGDVARAASRPRSPWPIPSMVYTGTLMTENAFYPVFLAVALSARRGSSGRRRATRRSLARALPLAFLTRAQAIALAARGR